jgi:hypothetical protein
MNNQGPGGFQFDEDELAFSTHIPYDSAAKGSPEQRGGGPHDFQGSDPNRSDPTSRQLFSEAADNSFHLG